MDVKDIIKKENFVYGKSKVLTDNPMHYCPGCTHGVVHKVLAEVIEELGIQDKTIGVSPVGCAVLAYNYLDIDWHEAAHGRAPAVASAINRLYPDKLCSPTRAMATWPQSAQPRLCTPATVARNSSPYSSTTPSTA